MDDITAAAGKGIESLFDKGATITVLVLVGIGGVLLFKYLLKRCDERFDASLTRQQVLTDKMADVVERNTVAHTQSLGMLETISDAIKDLRRGP